VRRIVLKLGGHALDDLSATSEVLVALAHDVAQLRDDGVEVVVVHGGGPQIAELLTRVGLVSEFRDGLRITSPEVMTYVAMALSQVNVALVAALHHAGLACVGLTGVDGGLTFGRSLGEPWDRAAAVASMNVDVLVAQWRAGFVPVVSPLAYGAGGELFNCNADIVAGALAATLDAETLVLLSDIDQLRADPDDATSVLARVDRATVRAMIENGAARDGMRPKMTAALDALEAGAARVVLANGTRPHAVHDVVRGQIPTTEVVA